ncbi:flagellar protein FlaG [Caldinitratiruptor microaerophilus]|uniref:flagellar protein FlaG n=1 Tax=Caldinitratiruptor microaerophilus TaxID=671077 RepID=UPI002232C473|nr:flagellar protein FlaG [Caldinitratiruptor microaerophilus]
MPRPLEGAAVAVEGSVAAESESGVALESAVSRLNETARIFDRTFRFHVDEDSGRIVVRVFNSVTGELIGQIPPEEVLRVAAGIREFLGLLLDRYA